MADEKKVGRKPVELDQRQFEELCHIQCTEEEICAVLHVTDKTLSRWCRRTYGVPFKEAFARLRAGGCMSLRRAQYETAVTEHNPTLLIWLGKQYLGQYDPDKAKKDSEEGKEDGVQIINDLEDDAGVVSP